jgi:streptogramin lyase
MPRHRSATAVFRLALIGIVSWVVGGSGIAGAQSFTEYAVTTAGGMPAGITFGPDGNHWYTEEAGNKIATITPATAFTSFPPFPSIT